MKSRNVILTLFLILIISGIFLCRKWQEPGRKEVLDRGPSRLSYTAQATCLMKCQQVGKEEIEQVIKKGVILLNKSNRFNRPCPTFAVQAATSKGRSVHVLLRQCAQETTVLSCYIIKQNIQCQCPGNGNKVN